jgi:hypothetical protein
VKHECRVAGRAQFAARSGSRRSIGGAAETSYLEVKRTVDTTPKLGLVRVATFPLAPDDRTCLCSYPSTPGGMRWRAPGGW